LLSGRAAEEIVLGNISTGASDDLEKASEIVRSMLGVYGMSTRLPNVSLADHGGGYLGRDFAQAPHSEDVARNLDAELTEIIDHCYQEAKTLLIRERERLELLAERLLEAEQLDRATLLSLLGASPAPGSNSDQRSSVPG
jgi:cell division protease FtsH